MHVNTINGLQIRWNILLQSIFRLFIQNYIYQRSKFPTTSCVFPDALGVLSVT